MAFAFMVGCATVVVVSAIWKETPLSVSIGKEFHFSTGNQNTCPEKFEKKQDDTHEKQDDTHEKQDDTHEKKKKKRKGIRKLLCCYNTENDA